MNDVERELIIGVVATLEQIWSELRQKYGQTAPIDQIQVIANKLRRLVEGAD